jgi:hypothetical protein
MSESKSLIKLEVLCPPLYLLQKTEQAEMKGWKLYVCILYRIGSTYRQQLDMFTVERYAHGTYNEPRDNYY